MYQLTGNDAAKQVFFVNPDSGLVSLKKTLAETADEAFMVIGQAFYLICRIH